MKIACLKHVDYEGPAYFPAWAAREGHVLEEFLVPDTGVPRPGGHERVIVIGGPMSVWQTDSHPWLIDEKRYLADLLSANVPVLGICLGAQLLAELLGAEVRPGEHKEIGWFELETAPDSRGTWLGDVLPPTFRSFFWHGDFFTLPAGAIPVAGSRAHAVQGFVHGSSLALQFHLEATSAWARRLIHRDSHELVEGPFIQPAARLLDTPGELFEANNRLLDRVMERWLAAVAG